MTISGTMWEVGSAVSLALTPIEKWSAARRLNPTFVSEYWLILLVGMVLLVLTLVLWQVSFRRSARRPEVPRESFGEHAVRKGLSARECQILLAIVGRSGLPRHDGIFASPDAFDRGVTKLLAECVGSRTPQENEQLRAEMTRLRKKLGFQGAAVSGGPKKSKARGSRGIPVGHPVELLRRADRPEAAIQAEVVRNDDVELAVEAEMPVASQAGECWYVRYDFEMSAWEFDTSAVSCEGRRLALNHSQEIRLVNRRRFARVAANASALVAHFPLLKSASTIPPEAPEGSTPAERFGDGPEFVEAVVTELAGPGLQVKAPLSVQAGDRVLVVFRLGEPVTAKDEENDATEQWQIIEGLGQVTRCQTVGDEMLIALELTGLSDTELDELMRIADAGSSRVNGHGRGDTNGEGTEASSESAAETSTVIQGA